MFLHVKTHLLQNPKVPKNVIGFNNHAERSTPPYHLDIDNPLPRFGCPPVSSRPGWLHHVDPYRQEPVPLPPPPGGQWGPGWTSLG